ncbi:MAG TPA: phosphoethanolamine--lipid A transferase [bacterium]|nr:phosphoethanolamine--lipid A transferase [bacterium]
MLKAFTQKKILQFSLIKFIFSLSLFFTIFDNFAFYRNILKYYPLQLENLLFLLSIIFLLFCSINIVLLLFCFRSICKQVAILFLIISAVVSYFSDSYNVVIDHTMIQNVLQTNKKEAFELLNLKLFGYLFFLGILPSFFFIFIKIEKKSFGKEILEKLKLLIGIIIIVIITILIFGKYYATFFREHKELRYYANPTYYVYSLYKYIEINVKSQTKIKTRVAEDAFIPQSERGRKLCILVIGEAARADRFSLNGYHRNTNPLLLTEKENIVVFSDFFSLATSTATSLPLIFSFYNSYEKATRRENVLDVLMRCGVNILWRDNNSSSKGVAADSIYQSFVDTNNFDEIMLNGLTEYIENKKSGDILIVLHQLGSHGPKYNIRYPEEFALFKPLPAANTPLEKWTKEELDNAYDNTILYTDYFLYKAIELLKMYSDKYKTILIYTSDHGESLGEKGIFLHGLPMIIAPKEQKHIMTFIWFGELYKSEIDINILRDKASREHFDHKIIPHTLLGFFKVKTKIYNPVLDVFNVSK